MAKALLKKPSAKIMVFGTFEILHPGHLSFFRQARALSAHSRLIVSVARDINARRIKRRKVSVSEKTRLQRVKAVPGVDLAVLGGLKNYFAHIRRIRPDIIALGYDQSAYVKRLSVDLKKAQMPTRIVRLKAYRPQFYKTSLIKSAMLKLKSSKKHADRN